MKKIFVVFFLAAIMLLMPINAAVAGNIHDKNIIYTLNNNGAPEFYITQQQYDSLKSFIELKFDEENRDEALTILENVIDENLKVDMINLADQIIKYSFQRIDESKLENLLTMSVLKPQETIDQLKILIEEHWNIVNGEFVNSLFGELLDKIIEQIKNRLGWIYTFFTDGVSLVRSGAALAVNFIKPAIATLSVYLVMLINDIISAPKDFANAIKELFQGGDTQEFINIILASIENFSKHIADFIEFLKSLVTDPELLAFLNQIKGYINWLGTSPWRDKITISGTVTTLFFNIPIVGATIASRGVNTTTDSNGRYEFQVSPSDDSADSIPANSFYGLHDCTITVLMNDEVLKQSSTVLSYSFSGGEINWPFKISLLRNTDMAIITIIIEKISTIFEKIQNKREISQPGEIETIENTTPINEEIISQPEINPEPESTPRPDANTDPNPDTDPNPYPDNDPNPEDNTEPTYDYIQIISIDPSGTVYADEGETITFTITTIGGSGNHYYILYTGDGTTKSGYMNGDTKNIQHTYNTQGIYEPDIEVHDLNTYYYDSSYDFATITIEQTANDVPGPNQI